MLSPIVILSKIVIFFNKFIFYILYIICKFLFTETWY
jgi:hypothetical protein